MTSRLVSLARRILELLCLILFDFMENDFFTRLENIMDIYEIYLFLLSLV